MKTTKYFLALLTVITVMACSKDDAPETPKKSTTPPTETPTNKAPATFDLIDIADGSDGIDLLPAFSWKAALDPEGEAVTYDLYLDEQEDPATLVATNLTEPTFTATDSLHLVTDYHWKVVAKDAKEASVTSAVKTFTTRDLNFPNEPVTPNASFTERDWHSMVTFSGRLWVIGGSGDGGYYNDVWNSSNGESWRKVSPDGSPIIKNLFPPRDGHATVIFNNKLWVIGGIGSSGRRNDVWYSSDGISWTEATPHAAFAPRTSHTAIVFHDKLWVIGGFDENFETKKDVWSSSDGITWKEEIPSANFPGRNRHSSLVFQDKLWVIGGYDENNDDKNDVWSSRDGIEWKEVTSNAQFKSLAGGSAVVFDDKIMLLGARDENGYTKDIWSSPEGKNWSVMTTTNDFPELRLPKATVFHNKIWFNNVRSKEIWALD